jgi:hypothetical protein
MSDLINPYQSPSGVTRDHESPEKAQSHVRTTESTAMLLRLAIMVVAICGYVILSTARLFEDHLDLKMPNVFSRGAGWFFAAAWILATAAVAVLRQGGWPRTIGIALITMYLLGMAAVALEFLITVWSPTWSLV